MTVIVAEKLREAPAGEFAPMVPRDVREATRGCPAAQSLWVEAMSKPEGWEMGNRERMARDMSWTIYRTRTAINWLIEAGLYVAERIQTDDGRWITACRFVGSAIVKAASAQVTPKVGKPKVEKAAGIPSPERRGRERRGLRTKRTIAALTDLLPAHSPDTCLREAKGEPCRQCAKARATLADQHKQSELARLVADRDRIAAEPANECEHGSDRSWVTRDGRPRCALCRAAAAQTG